MCFHTSVIVILTYMMFRASLTTHNLNKKIPPFTWEANKSNSCKFKVVNFMYYHGLCQQTGILISGSFWKFVRAFCAFFFCVSQKLDALLQIKKLSLVKLNNHFVFQFRIISIYNKFIIYYLLCFLNRTMLSGTNCRKNGKENGKLYSRTKNLSLCRSI